MSVGKMQMADVLDFAFLGAELHASIYSFPLLMNGLIRWWVFMRRYQSCDETPEPSRNYAVTIFRSHATRTHTRCFQQSSSSQTCILWINEAALDN